MIIGILSLATLFCALMSKYYPWLRMPAIIGSVALSALMLAGIGAHTESPAMRIFLSATWAVSAISHGVVLSLRAKNDN